MQRITLSVDDELAEDFERWAQRHGYENRSEAFRDLLRQQLSQEQQQDGAADSHCVAALSYVYNHHERQLASRLAANQHDHHGLCLSTLHVHLDHDDCLEVAVLRGHLKQVREFAASLIAERGVRHGQLHLVPVEVQFTQVHGEPHLHLHPSR